MFSINKLKIITFVIFGGVLFNAHANSLKYILNNALNNAPELLEAKADIDISVARVNQARAQHFPVISVTGNKLLGQYHRDESDYDNNSFTPGLRGELNLYSFGGIENDVERNEKEQLYYQFKYNETKENVAYTISDLYLKALLAKESIAVKKKSLDRHNKIISELNVIARNDEGRVSEYVQAEARKILVEQDINYYEKELMTTLSTLSKYTGFPVGESDLVNPFSDMTVSDMYRDFTAENNNQNPAYLVSQADIDAKKLGVKVENKKQLPKINLTGNITEDDRQIGIDVTWDIINFSSLYSIDEKVSQLNAAQQRMDRVIRDIEEARRLSVINIQKSTQKLKILDAQILSSTKVVDFYQLQFNVARRSLLDVLNAEKELSDVELSYATTLSDLRYGMLDYLYAQGTLSHWALNSLAH
ncbi:MULTISPECIES: TolC family protein [Proteus]|uniref:TolC family protein n=1 Tax=Proteus TaxID=583 RepID=UPI0013782E26|nr:TolC family protein [Proteus penneri]NBL79223.1 TolC family protein [Proteus sp. G2672]NBM02480.1 TolC family protein [Proteus sp. G2671]NBM48293.1 TolC family protein [Proteus sp. G2666]NBM58491.1 TolC family protein [Proteus sp. G2667]NBM90264.1 TolC family protein [Proteus sp. G2658]NBM91885.1 TolC family protein [Proteus sp. G2662]NBN24614.1 TolC family protein [Proteus sp. G2657]